jgi:hypothetical protein
VKKLMPRTFWLIVKGEAGPMDVLRINLASGEAALPLFSFEDEARTFLEFGALDGDWLARLTAAGDSSQYFLVSAWASVGSRWIRYRVPTVLPGTAS